jgi:transposase
MLKISIIIWDNAATHKALYQWGWQNKIYFIPLPAYSPDLNPIERVWKLLKKWVNETRFVKQLDKLIQLYQQGFDMLTVQRSFMKGWLEKYQTIFSWICLINVSQ